jgi:shikimate dehydrogenase
VSEDSVCYDLAYGRGHTPFTLWAKSLYAARVCKGWGMLVEQAAESFFLWRGVRPNTHSVLEALTRKT